ncbi:MAG: hypothetical protein AAF585_13480 [Verrucomicrobiota bacterium]
MTFASDLADQQKCVEIQDAVAVTRAQTADHVDHLLKLDGGLRLEAINRLKLLSSAMLRANATSAEFKNRLSQFQSVLKLEAGSLADEESRERFLTHWLRPIAEHAFGNPDQWRLLSPNIPTKPDKPLPNWPGRISLWLWAVSIALNWGQAAPSAADVDAVRHSMIIVLVSTLGLFLGGIGLARSGDRGRKAAFIGTLGNALQVAGICVRLLLV